MEWRLFGSVQPGEGCEGVKPVECPGADAQDSCWISRVHHGKRRNSRRKSLLAGAVALPREFGAGLRVAGWRWSLRSVVRFAAGAADRVLWCGRGWDDGARAARDAGSTWDASPCKSLAPGP